MKKIAFILFLFMLFTLVACGSESYENVDHLRKDITNVTMNNKTVVYDGNEHSILVDGTIPEGVSIEYTGNQKKDVGTYIVNVILSGKEYNTKKLSATLTITNRTIIGMSFSEKVVTYNGNLHRIEVVGNLPNGVTVAYSSTVSGIANEASEVGLYPITATISGIGYETLVLKADLNIIPYGDPVITGITFENKTVVYDGNEHLISISGNLPEGANVVYTSTTQGVMNKATNVGVYNVTATISKEGFQTLTLQAVLTISASQNLQFESATLNDLSVEYDSFEHSIVVNGVLPEGTVITYESNVDGISNAASEVGVYNISARLTKSGYETLVLQAKLTIKAVDKERFIYFYNNSIYFNNGLDSDRLYTYNQDGVTKVNNDEAQYMISHNGMMYYVSSGLISTSIKTLNNNTTQTIYSVNARYLVTDGTNLYYSVNTLFGESGIYKLNIDGEDPVATKVFTGKAKNLIIVDNDIYFVNGSDDNRVYKVNKNAIDGIATLVADQKVTEMVYHNGSLYFTVNNVLGNYLARFIISSSTLVKLTSDNAKYLVVAGQYIYYSNVDMINTQVYGKGVYRIALNGLTDNNAAGELVYQTDYNVSSLYSKDSQTILFYRLSDKHLLSINTSTKVVTDLMDGFVAPNQDSVQTLSKFESFVWGTRVYYINNYVDGALFYYDTKTNQTIRVTSNGVKSFSIIGDFLFFNQVSWLINNDLYMINLKQGGLPQKISNNDSRDMVIHNGFLYYVKENALGVGTAITRISLDGTFTEVDVYDKNSHNLTIQDGKLYFIKGAGVDEIWRADIQSNGELSNLVRLGSDKTDWFVVVGDSIYYRAVGIINKTLSKMDLDGTNKVVVISGYDPISFIIRDGLIYFTNDTASGPKDGIYKANLDGTDIQLLYENSKFGDGFAIEMNIVGNYLYYYSKSGSNGDFKFHRLNLSTLLSDPIE